MATESNKNPLSIASIYIDKLFGNLTYSIPNDNIDISKLLILYGDNGTGKTTILKLLFYLLSTKDRSGYKSRLAETKFKKISVSFQNGFEIGAQRASDLVGSYEFYLSKNSLKFKTIILRANSENAIQLEPNSKEDQTYREILIYLRELNITTFYLSDDRKILNSVTSQHGNDEMMKISFEQDDLFYKNKNRFLEDRDFTLDATITKFNLWIQDKLISGSKVGEKNSQNIFSDIIKNYITLSSETIIRTNNDLLRDLDDLEVKLPPFVNLGLIDFIDSSTIKKSIRKAKTNDQLRFLDTVITPFLDGINAKLIALENVEYTLTLFINTVNEYFSNKSLSFNLNKGFKLENNEQEIEFQWLSSGEKQLLLLLINIITSADDATVYIIDEPEISLNIKWQRKLMKTLLEFSKGKNIQFIIATHSFEILAGHNKNISTLIPKQNVHREEKY